MPFLRFSRDKRGYEHIYLVHTQNRRGKPSRQRVLYWYRTPPGIRVGRAPFDEDVRRRLEAQNPDVVFDWPAIIATPMPPPAENEQWRERRRAERAARQAQRVQDEVEAESEHDATEPPSTVQPDESTGEDQALSLAPSSNESETALLDIEPQPTSGSDSPAQTVPGSSETPAPSMQPSEGSHEAARRGRRRGGRRRHGRRQLGALPNQGPPHSGNPVVPTDPGPGSGETVPDSETTESIESNEE